MPKSGLKFAPELEWALAAHWWNYNLADFEALDGDEQSRLVAVYRTDSQIKAVLDHHYAEEQRRKQQAQQRKGGGKRRG